MYVPNQIWTLALVAAGIGQSLINVFKYAPAPGAPAYALDPQYIALNFQSIVLPKIRAVVSDQTNFQRIDLQESAPGNQFYSYSITANNTGLISGEVNPAFVAWSYAANRASKGLRSAHKRFGLVAESSVTNGAPAFSMTSALNALSDALKLPLEDAGGVNNTGLYPVSVSYVVNGQPRAVAIAEVVRAWSFKGVTSQVSRRN